jgi:hypothetical protein
MRKVSVTENINPDGVTDASEAGSGARAKAPTTKA